MGLEQAEAAIVEHYRRLVRLGYLVLPPSLGRHRRVLTAHGLVQRALPRSKSTAEAVPLPPQRGADGAVIDPGYAYVRQRVLRAALDAGRPARLAGRDLPSWVPRRPLLLPRVLGLRLFPQAGGAEELALDQELSKVSAMTRAAFALSRLEGLTPEAVRALLTSAGLSEGQARGAVTSAATVYPTGDRPEPGGAEAGAVEAPLPTLDDPCNLQARPTDLLRRRHYLKAAVAVAAAVVVGAGLLIALPGEDTPAFASNQSARQALDPALLLRAEPDAWEQSARLDFSVWPARGSAVDDTELLRRALNTWAGPGRSVVVSTTPGTSTGPAAGPPRLLYAGTVDGASLVVFHDGLRLVRYGEPEGGGQAVLDFARTDGADQTTAALALGRGPGTARYLTAPWVTDAEVRDLLAPEEDPVPLALDDEGLTEEAPNSLTDEECSSYPVLAVSGAGGEPPLVQADMGELVPVGLTYGAPGEAVGSPLEAGEATQRWARTACHLSAVHGAGVKSVNTWEFAQQELPGQAGTAHWVCTRAETWRGDGSHAMTQFQGPPAAGAPDGAPGSMAARSESGTACADRSPGVLSGVLWRSEESEWFLLAAGSAEVTAISADGAVNGVADGRLLVLPAEEGAEAELTATLADGSTMPALG